MSNSPRWLIIHTQVSSVMGTGEGGYSPRGQSRGFLKKMIGAMIVTVCQGTV